MKRKQWFVEIYEDENMIYVHRSGAWLMDHVKRNDPMLVGAIVLDDKDRVAVQKEFKDERVATVSVRWNKYADQLGLNRK